MSRQYTSYWNAFLLDLDVDLDLVACLFNERATYLLTMASVCLFVCGQLMTP